MAVDPFLTTVGKILGDDGFVPWVEEAAFKFSMYNFVMAQRVNVMGDMTGWNVRKVSEYRRPKGAHKLEEGEPIPVSRLDRKRLAEIEPEEWGDKYLLTDRRISTDLEDVVADAATALGYSLGRKREQLLFQALIEAADIAGHNLQLSGSDYQLAQAVQLQAFYEGKSWGGDIYHVIHPYQQLDIMEELLDLEKSANPAFRNSMISSWTFGGFGGLNVAVSGMVPRNVTFRLVMAGAVQGNTFRLRFGLEDTASITVGASVAATLTAIENALNALDVAVENGWTFDATGTTYDDIEVTSNAYVDEEMQLEIGQDADANEFDNVTGGLVIQEVSATARAPFFQRNAVVYDRRSRLNAFRSFDPDTRTLKIGAYEVYGVGPWNARLASYIETDATSPVAVP